RPAFPTAAAGGAGRAVARMRRATDCGLDLRTRRLPGGIRSRWSTGAQDPRLGRDRRRVSAVIQSRQARSLSFGSEAAAYERGRPSYPPEAIDWLLPPRGRGGLGP